VVCRGREQDRCNAGGKDIKNKEVIYLVEDTPYIKKPEDKIYEVYYHNGVRLGDFLRDVDGYYKFWPDGERNGFWEGYVLRAIADKEEELNRKWDQIIQNDPKINGEQE